MVLLEKDRFSDLSEPLKSVQINNLFARSVIEKLVTGKIYVDNKYEPKTFYVVHPYGMSLLFGDCRNAEFNNAFRGYALNTHKIRENYEWMQANPGDWDQVLNELFKDCSIKSSENTDKKDNGIIELNTRVNFKFNREKYLKFKKDYNSVGKNIVRTDKQIFKDMKGSVVPYFFWDNADDFFSKGIGFSLFHDNKLASTAYSVFLFEGLLELGIETVEEFRNMGFAQYTCSSLIDYCIDNNYEPIWACKLENTASYNLAQKLGFEPSRKLPYYRLCK